MRFAERFKDINEMERYIKSATPVPMIKHQILLVIAVTLGEIILLYNILLTELYITLVTHTLDKVR